MMKVLGVSGSPLYNSNTDRALKVALEATGLETEFIKLSEYTITPCRACLGCVDTNRFYMMEKGMNFVGSVKILGNVPCIK